MNYRHLIAALAFAGLAVAVPASAQSGAKPEPCAGLAAEDPAGDQAIGLAGNFTPIPAEDTVDLTKMFFRSENGKVTVNFQLTNASATPPAGTAGSGIRILYDNPADLFLDIDISATGTTYTYGHFEDTGPVGDGETTGAIFEGKDGVISVDLPVTHGGKPGMKLNGTAFSFYSTGVILLSTDFIPDDPGTWKYNGALCAGSTAPTAAPPATTEPGTTPAPAPQPGTPQATKLGKLDVKASPTSLKAKKVKKSVTFTLTSKEEVSGLTAALKKGSKTVGTGKLAKLAKGKTKLKLKITSKLKKGAYQLVLNGKKADGSNGAAVLKIKVK